MEINFRKNILIFMLGALVMMHPSHAVRVNGQAITLTGNEGELSYTPANLSQNSNMILQIQGDDFTIGTINDSSLCEQASTMYQELESQKKALTFFPGKTVKLSAPSVKIINIYAPIEESLIVEGASFISCDTTIAEVKTSTHFTAPKLQFQRFFTPYTGEVSFNAPEGTDHWLTSIKLIPSTKDRLPFGYFLQGTLQFEPPATEDPFIILGAESVVIKFKKI